MIREVSVAALTLFLGACASTGPEAKAPETTAPPATANAVAADNPELDTTDAPELASAEAEYDPNEVICRRERESGSNFYRKTCYTRAQLEARQETDQEALRQMRSMRSGSQSEVQGQGPSGG